MRTRVHPSLAEHREARDAEAVLRSCVHCGFCLSACPTYRVTGDEADSPRGRILLVRLLLEQDGDPATVQRHLDRCLTCRACESVCPSGVHYARLLDAGRALLETGTRRGLAGRAWRYLVLHLLASRALFAGLLRLGRWLRPLLPPVLRRLVPPRRTDAFPQAQTPAVAPVRRMLVLEGCLQSELSPEVNRWLAALLGSRGIELQSIAPAVCCGALAHHTGDRSGALASIRRFVDSCWPFVEAGGEAVLVSASGCGAFMLEHGHLLRDDPLYGPKAARVAAVCRDPSEVIASEFAGERGAAGGPRVAWHAPCTLQYALGVRGRVEALLEAAGFTLTATTDTGTCCGSAGSYSLLEPGLAGRLRQLKLDGLTAAAPGMILTANVGCQFHLQAGTDLPVRHWIEAYARRLLRQE